MLKGISISLVSLSLVVGFQASATIENTLDTIDFKSICKGEGGSVELGQEVQLQAGTTYSLVLKQIIALRNELNKDKKKTENPAIKKLIENLNKDIDALYSVNPHMKLPQACLAQKGIKSKK